MMVKPVILILVIRVHLKLAREEGLNLSVNVTHNNNGHHYRIAIDIAKEGAEVFDLTPYFKGRVGDNNFGLQIVWYYQG